jgi:mRNA-degrading endonuclease toxin of MazEF toxin-antitoxin module
MTLPNLNLKRGSIVSCRFPLNENPDIAGPSARPAMVLAVFPNPRNKSEKMVIVAYGTSRKTRAKLGYEIRISNSDDMISCNLHRPTRFTLNRMRILPFTNEFFTYGSNGTPVIGNIPNSVMSALNFHLDKLATHADELNFFRPKEAIKKGKTFDPQQIDNFMKEKMTGLERIPTQGRVRRGLYGRG